MTVVAVRVQETWFECSWCGVAAESIEQLLDRGFHEAHDDDCRVVWDGSLTEVRCVRYPEVFIEIDGREEYDL